MYKRYPLDPEYLLKIKSFKSFELTIVGRDPYPTEPIDIPFMIHSWNGLDGKSAGRYLVRSIYGSIPEVKYGYPLCFAFHMLDCGVVLLNSSYHYLRKETINQKHKDFIKEAYSVNKPIFDKSKTVLLCGDASNMMKFVNTKLNSKKFIPIIHPCPLSKVQGDVKEWDKYWSDNALKKMKN